MYISARWLEVWFVGCWALRVSSKGTRSAPKGVDCLKLVVNPPETCVSTLLSSAKAEQGAGAVTYFLGICLFDFLTTNVIGFLNRAGKCV